MANPKEKAVEFAFPVKGWDTNSARQDQPKRTSPDLLNVWPYDLDRRARGAKRPGFEVLTGGTIGDITNTYRQARLCGSEVASGLYVSTLEIGAYPYFFGYHEENCYTVLGTDPAIEDPVGTIVPSTERVPHTSCDDCTDVTPPPPPPVPYRRLRRCVDNVFGAYYIAMSDVPSLPNAFKRAGDGVCYRVQASDPIVFAPGDLIGTHTTFPTCVACLDDGDVGTDEYYQFLDCDGDAPSVYWIKTSDVADLPFYIRLPDSDHVLYIPEGATPGTEPDYILTPRSVPPDFYPAGSCDPGCGKCYLGIDMPASATVTFAGIETAGPCVGFGGGNWWVSGYATGTFNLTHRSEVDGECIYRSDRIDTVGAYCCYTPSVECDACAPDSLFGRFEDGFYVELRIRRISPGVWKWRIRTLGGFGIGIDGAYFDAETGNLPSCLGEGESVLVDNGNHSFGYAGCGTIEGKFGKGGTAYGTLNM